MAEALAKARDAAARADKPLHVLLTVNAAWNVWNFRRPVIAALLADGHRVTVLAPADDAAERIGRIGCGFIPLPMDPTGTNPLRELALLWRLRSAFAELRPDVILSYTIKNNIYGALAARPLGVPFIPNVSGLGTAFLKGGALRMLSERLYRPAFKRAPAVFFQNRADSELFVGRELIRPQQVRLLPGSGADLEHFAPLPYPPPDAPPTFLMIARMLSYKGAFEFVEAARLVRQVHPDARFQLLGPVLPGHGMAIAPQQIESWQRSHGIEYLGTCDDIREQVANAHCVVLASYREGTSKALIEAAAMARPLIVSDAPGCREVVDDGVTGFICEARSAESLAEACLRLLALPREAQAALGRAGREKICREYDEGLVVEAYRRAIADALVNPAR